MGEQKHGKEEGIRGEGLLFRSHGASLGQGYSPLYNFAHTDYAKRCGPIADLREFLRHMIHSKNKRFTREIKKLMIS